MPTSTRSLLIDATHFGADRPTGVEGYVDALLPRLSALLRAEGVAVSWVGHAVRPPAGLPDGVAWVHAPHTRFWGQVGLRRLLRRLRLSLYFTPSGVPPWRSPVPTAFTAHDLSAYAAPRSYSPGQLFRLRTLSERVARQAAAILVPSRFTKGQVERHWKVDAERVAVTPLGYEAPAAEPEPVAGLEGRRYVLFLGRLERKKNLGVLLAALPALPEDACLVLAGGRGYGYRQVRRSVDALPQALRARVVTPGYVSEGQRRWLYERCAAVAVPCPVEGFGLPVLEGLAAGRPVVCADQGAASEIAPDAAFLCPPSDASAWAAALAEALAGGPEVDRRVREGLARSKDYTWDRTAELTAATLLTHLS